MKLLFELVAGHAVADYGLQTAYMASEKGRNPAVMAAHCLVHGFTVCQVLRQNEVRHAAAYAACETVAHAGIDSAKCHLGTPEWIDQLLHILCKVIIALVAWRYRDE